MSEWLNGGIKMDIQSVPGIGPKAAEFLEKKGVTITQVSPSSLVDSFVSVVASCGIAKITHLVSFIILQHLLAKYMSLATTEERENTDGEMETMLDVYVTNQQFWHFLQDAGVNAARSGIVQAVNRKVAQMDSAFLDNTEYDEDE